MKEISLTQGKVAVVDEEDYASVSRHAWQYMTNGYAARSTKKGVVYMHREILKAPPNLLVDHINHNKLDNRKQNIRLCTEHQSHGNMKPQNRARSKFKGVFSISNTKGKPWRAQINQKGITMYLGSFWTEEEAAKAYNEAAKKYFGKFAWLNPLSDLA